MAGGLVKRSGPPIDYLGTLTVEVAGRTFTAVGAYAQPVDQLGRFTSLFVFVGVPAVLGGPPCLFITGLGGGAGYNRRLVLPTEITDVPSFPLVTAIEDGINTDPMASLTRLGSAMPPQRGSLWMAAGIRFTSFSFVRSVAVVYVTLGRDAEIGLLGVARASIPPPDAGFGSLELAFVELALKARFSPSEGMLSVQAQLTDNSWLLSRDCQLTGGFAFFVWFKRDQFVLTLGGYHPSFVKPPEFPVVPRLGFHWAVSDAVVIKGEAYFALTSSSVMAGGRLEVSYRQGRDLRLVHRVRRLPDRLGPVPLRHRRRGLGDGRFPDQGLLLRLRDHRRQRVARRVGAPGRPAAARRGDPGPGDLQRHRRIRPPVARSADLHRLGGVPGQVRDRRRR